jgi:hypothetical protein
MEIIHTYLLTVGDKQVKLCLYQSDTDDTDDTDNIWLDVEDEDSSKVYIEQIT